MRFPHLYYGIKTLLGPQIIPWGWAYNNIPEIGQDNLYNSLQLMSILGCIDLFSSPFKISTHLLHMDPKSTPIHGNCILSPPTFGVRVDGNFHAFPWFGGYLWSWRIYVHDTHPKYSIYGHPKVKADQLTWREGQGWSAGMVWRSRPYPYLEENGHFKVKDGHLTLLACLPIALSLVWNLDEATSNLWQSIWHALYFKIK